MEDMMQTIAPRSQPVEAPSDYPFPKDETNHIPWERVTQQLDKSRNFWIATVRPDGRPHVAPLWAVWHGNVLYFEGSPATRWARNLAVNPAASMNLESGLDVVIVEGRAESFRLEPELRGRLIDAWAAKYGEYGPNQETEELFRLIPRTIRAWSASMEDGARWSFDGV